MPDYLIWDLSLNKTIENWDQEDPYNPVAQFETWSEISDYRFGIILIYYPGNDTVIPPYTDLDIINFKFYQNQKYSATVVHTKPGPIGRVLYTVDTVDTVYGLQIERTVCRT